MIMILVTKQQEEREKEERVWYGVKQEGIAACKGKWLIVLILIVIVIVIVIVNSRNT